MNYPCKDCIIKGNCSKLCPKAHLSDKFNSLILNKCCPDCGGREVDSHKIVITFIVISCRSCRSRFTLEIYSDRIDINRSTNEKGWIGTNERKSDVYTTLTIEELIDRVKNIGWK
jgi:hypothetical protein